ncbi:pyruvate formate lyase family protein [Chakrabartyella piscis]|uniref:pyruvate formate lyase family protein n=1 Tax=Chakrabartyella piscis TaxID=2918914 RepID=UPI0029583A41|nr:pyruvate formate lyase family protein [Chakrabartyella piscis]
MGKIQFINEFPATEEFTLDKRIKLLRQRKLEQTEEKIEMEGGLDEDDYGRVVCPDDFYFEPDSNHPDGSYYGYEGWSHNYCKLLREHPLYCDPLDAFVGRGFFFMTRQKGSLWNPDHPYTELKSAFDEYNIVCGIGSDGHFTPDLNMGFDMGWIGILKKLEKFEQINTAPENEIFYTTEKKMVNAIMTFLNRVADELMALSEEENNPYLKQNLVEMSQTNRKIANDKPETLRECIQWMCWFSFFSRLYNRGPSGGQLDELLRPFYERDIAAGIIDDETAKFYIACLYLNDTRYYQLAGPDDNGDDMASKISYLILEAADWINIACNLTVRVHDNMNEDFFTKAVGYLFKNKNGWPRFSGDNSLVDGFMRCGYEKNLARKRLAAGCSWMSIPGMEYTLNDLVKINAAKVFEVAYYEMVKSGEYGTDKLWEIFSKHLERAVNTTAKGIKFHLTWQDQNEPELICNLLSQGPVEKGLDVTKSAMYFNMCIDGSGIATVADSFAACEQRVEKEGKITWEALTKQLELNYNDIDGEYIRQMMLHSERFGGGDSLADRWASRINELFTNLVRKECDNYEGINFIPGWFSWSNTLEFGSRVRATPNGRRNGEAINHGANPTSGFRKDGAVTAMANSIANVQPFFGNCAPVQLEIDPGIADTEEGVGKMVSMIRTILETGNTLLNINIINKEQILEAHKDPSKYPDLVVRVTGFTSYFAMLSPEFRQLVVDRVLAVNGEC